MVRSEVGVAWSLDSKAEYCTTPRRGNEAISSRQEAVRLMEAETESYESGIQKKTSMKTKANKGKHSEASQIFEKNPLPSPDSWFSYH